MKTPWTKGPWTLGDENNGSAEVCMGDVAASFDRYSRDPGKCGQMVIEREEMLANAHLAIAAPDLAEALARMLSVSDCACIAAGGFCGICNSRLVRSSVTEHHDDCPTVAARAALRKAGAL